MNLQQLSRLLAGMHQRGIHFQAPVKILTLKGVKGISTISISAEGIILLHESRGNINVARQIITRLTDDIDGGEADETVTFALDGQTYEIDLSAKNAGKLRQALSAYVEKGVRVPPAGTKRPVTPGGRSAHNAAVNKRINTAIREWAASKGIPVSPRGRIKQDVVDRYEAELKGGQPTLPLEATTTPPTPAVKKPTVDDARSWARGIVGDRVDGLNPAGLNKLIKIYGNGRSEDALWELAGDIPQVPTAAFDDGSVASELPAAKKTPARKAPAKKAPAKATSKASS